MRTHTHTCDARPRSGVVVHSGFRSEQQLPCAACADGGWVSLSATDRTRILVPRFSTPARRSPLEDRSLRSCHNAQCPSLEHRADAVRACARPCANRSSLDARRDARTLRRSQKGTLSIALHLLSCTAGVRNAMRVPALVAREGTRYSPPLCRFLYSGQDTTGHNLNSTSLCVPAYKRAVRPGRQAGDYSWSRSETEGEFAEQVSSSGQTQDLMLPK